MLFSDASDNATIQNSILYHWKSSHQIKENKVCEHDHISCWYANWATNLPMVTTKYDLAIIMTYLLKSWNFSAIGTFLPTSFSPFVQRQASWAIGTWWPTGSTANWQLKHKTKQLACQRI